MKKKSLMMAAYHLAKRSGVNCEAQGRVAADVFLGGGTPEAVSASWVLAGVPDGDIKATLGGAVFRIVEDYRKGNNTNDTQLIRSKIKA